MPYTTPKTNWEVKPLVNGTYQGDWFNITDYRRIVSNLTYLRMLGQSLYSVTITYPSLVEQNEDDYPYDTILNALEDALYALTVATYSPPSYTGKKTWAANGSTPTYGDLNRIESAIAAIYAEFFTNTQDAVFTSEGDELYTADGYRVYIF